MPSEHLLFLHCHPIREAFLRTYREALYLILTTGRVMLVSRFQKTVKVLHLCFAGLCTAGVLAGILGAGVFLLRQMENSARQAPAGDFKAQPFIEEALARLEGQQAITDSLQQELDSGSYSFREPLAVVDPYGESPLTALLLFQTEQPCRIRIEIPGKAENQAVSCSFPELSTRHQVPVYALYPGEITPVTLVMLGEDGKELDRTQVELQTEPLSEYVDRQIILTNTYGEGCAPGLNFDYMHKLAFDQEGCIRWYLSHPEVFNCRSVEPRFLDHRFIVGQNVEESWAVLLYEMDLLGRIYSIYYSPYGAHHDIETLPDGNLLVTGCQGDTIEDVLCEIHRETGETLRVLDFKKILQRTRMIPGIGEIRDWMHLNSVVYDASDGSVIVSSNQQSSVVKVSWPEGRIRWILGDPTGYMPRLQNYLLTPIGEDFEYPYSQHDATILLDYDGDPHTTDILLFDNGYSRFLMDRDLQRQIQAGLVTAPENYSRLVHYRVHEKDGTVEQIWQYGKERGAELSSYHRGSAQLTAAGTILGAFNKDQILPEGTLIFEKGDPRICSANPLELDSEGRLIWDAEMFSKSKTGYTGCYRILRLPVYHEDSHQYDLGAVCKSRICIP